MYDGRNKIKGGNTSASYNAVITFGGQRNKNHYCNSASANLQTSSGGTIYATHNYWYNGANPTVSGSNIYYTPLLGSADCSDVLYRLESSSSDPEVVAVLDQQSLNQQSSNTEPTARAKLFEAKEKIGLHQFDSAVALLKEILQSPDMEEAHAALLELRAVYSQAPQAALQGFVQGLSNQKNNRLSTTAMQILADMYVFDQDWERALSILESLRAEPSTPEGFRATLSMAYIYQELGKPEEAIRLIGQAQATRAEEIGIVAVALNDFSAEAQNSSMRMLAETLLREAQAKNSDDQGVGSKLGAESYPNPFNPSTTIRFTLPSEGNVKLYVFDILGRQVATLVDGMLKSGNHQAVFDASHLASGLYMYRLEALGEVVAGTMQLLK